MRVHIYIYTVVLYVHVIIIAIHGGTCMQRSAFGDGALRLRCDLLELL